MTTRSRIVARVTTDGLDIAARAATLMQLTGISVGEALAVAAELGIAHGRNQVEVPTQTIEAAYSLVDVAHV